MNKSSPSKPMFDNVLKRRKQLSVKSHIPREVFGKDPKSMLKAWFSARPCEMKIEAEEQPYPEIQMKMQQQSQSPGSKSATISTQPKNSKF